MVLIRTRIFGGSQNTVYLSYEILEKSQSKGFKLDTIYENLKRVKARGQDLQYPLFIYLSNVRKRSTISLFLCRSWDE
jgi:hypothetical protein